MCDFSTCATCVCVGVGDRNDIPNSVDEDHEVVAIYEAEKVIFQHLV